MTAPDVSYLRNIVARSERSLREDNGLVARFIAALAEILAKYPWVPLDRDRAMIEKRYETYRDMVLKTPYADPSAMKLLLEIIAESNSKEKNMNLIALADSFLSSALIAKAG